MNVEGHISAYRNKKSMEILLLRSVHGIIHGIEGWWTQGKFLRLTSKHIEKNGLAIFLGLLRSSDPFDPVERSEYDQMTSGEKRKFLRSYANVGVDFRPSGEVWLLPMWMTGKNDGMISKETLITEPPITNEKFWTALKKAFDQAT